MSVASIFVATTQGLHRDLRDAVGGRQGDTLNWIPVEGANSVAVLVTHVLGSEREVLEVVRGRSTNRDRAAEFTSGPQEADELLARIEAADVLLAELGPGISQDDLHARTERPSAQKRLGARSGTFWLINCYAHGREHLGHIQLTLQLYDAVRARASPDRR